MKIIDHYSYPAIVTYFENGSTETYFPDFDIYTSNEDDRDLMKHAKEFLSVLIEGILMMKSFYQSRANCKIWRFKITKGLCLLKFLCQAKLI